MRRRQVIRGAGALLAPALLRPAAARGQEEAYPDRPIRLVVPWPSASYTSLLARLVGDALDDGLGQHVVLDNRPGANGVVGSDLAARAAPDGYTMLLADAGTFSRASLDRPAPFNPETDFDLVGPLGDLPLVVAGRGDLPPGGLAELLDVARHAPGRLNFASTGVGTVGHLAAVRMLAQAGVRGTHVPYRGPVLALRDLAAGRLDLFLDAAAGLAGPLRASDRLRALAVTSAERSVLLPGLPTVAEAALPGFSAAPWWGVAGPAGMPPEAVTRVSAELRHVLSEPALRDAMAAQGWRAFSMSPVEFSAFQRAEARKWAGAAAAAGLGTG